MTTDRARPRLIGHRGAPRERPENTLLSFLRALELGADGVELDVHCTRDGVVVVHHDAIPQAKAPTRALERRPIAQLTFDELQGFSIRDIALIPTLSEVLAVVKDRADVFVEIKQPDIEEAVIDTIRSGPAPSRAAIHSFDHETVRRARHLAPEIRGGILLDQPASDIVGAMRAADALDVWPLQELINEAFASDVHAAGGRVIAWTVNRPDRAVELTSFGVDALCTDQIPVIARALGG